MIYKNNVINGVNFPFPFQSDIESVHNINNNFNPVNGQHILNGGNIMQVQQNVPVSPTFSNSRFQPAIFNNQNSLDTIRVKNDICKSFEDDLLYCPRSLLSKKEQIACEKLDIIMFEQFLEVRNQQGLSSSGKGIQNPNNAFPKFNPYTSQSFNPVGNEE